MHFRRSRSCCIERRQKGINSTQHPLSINTFKIIAKLEQRIRELEGELDNEQRRSQDSQKNLAKQDRRLRELEFQVFTIIISMS